MKRCRTEACDIDSSCAVDAFSQKHNGSCQSMWLAARADGPEPLLLARRSGEPLSTGDADSAEEGGLSGEGPEGPLFGMPKPGVAIVEDIDTGFSTPAGASHPKAPLRNLPSSALLRSSGGPRPCGVVSPPRTVGAVTTLYSITQLEALLGVEPAPTQLDTTQLVRNEMNNLKCPAASLTAGAPMRLHAGETVIVVIHQGDPMVTTMTAALSHVRVFTLNVANLPPEDDCDLGCLMRTAAAVPPPASEEEADLFCAALPPDPAVGHQRPLQEPAGRASDDLLQRLSTVFCVETFGSTVGSSDSAHDEPHTSSRDVPRLPPLPLLVVWRVGGATQEEYPPASPQTYSSQPSATPPVAFNTRITTHGGPLVVKELTGTDHIHSISLFTPVYTLEHLLGSAVMEMQGTRAALRREEKDCGSKSRTLLYMGASWCPPCMRVVHAMPDMVRQDFPRSVHAFVKADMDLAKPIFDFFQVEIIPTFIILDNDVMWETYNQWQSLRSAPSSQTLLSSGHRLQEGLRRAEVARLQNSQRTLVSMFVEKNCTSLSFDEDF